MMDLHVRVLCLAFLAASLTRRSGASGPVIRCEPCDAAARLSCKPLPKDCAERVREPSCGCCMTCALSLGRRCGVYTARCGSGLTCQPQPGETKPLQALLLGLGICANSSSSSSRMSLTVKPTPVVCKLTDHAEIPDKEQTPTSSGPQTSYSTNRPTGPLKPLLHPLFSSAKADVFRQAQHKRTQSFKMGGLPGPLITDPQNFSLQTKQEPQYGPCRREMESILSSLKMINTLNPRGLRIPNCDKKGFYKKKQCRPSKGRKRGFCWCVDKYGQPLPSFGGKEQGDAQYYDFESQ
uniref:Insulin-like growth factor-binding protein 3 n=1 Tax=Oryzias latipes TaxID=8090 RepID=A0A3P9KMU9_ORYLA